MKCEVADDVTMVRVFSNIKLQIVTTSVTRGGDMLVASIFDENAHTCSTLIFVTKFLYQNIFCHSKLWRVGEWWWNVTKIKLYLLLNEALKCEIFFKYQSGTINQSSWHNKKWDVGKHSFEYTVKYQTHDHDKVFMSQQFQPSRAKIQPFPMLESWAA